MKKFLTLFTIIAFLNSLIGGWGDRRFGAFAQSITITPGSAGNIQIPSMTINQIKAIASPQVGMTVFDNTINCLKIYDGFSWKCTNQVQGNNSPILTPQKMGGNGNNNEKGYEVYTDASNNMYLSGTYYQSATIGDTTLTATSFDTFISKYNANGQRLWTRKLGVSQSAEGMAIAVDNAGNVYFSGNFIGTFTINVNTLNSFGESNFFLIKYNSNGIAQWARKGGASAYTFDNKALGFGLATDATGNIYASGTFRGTAVFGSLSLISASSNTNVYDDIFLIKYNSSGIEQWARRAGGNSHDAGREVAVNGSFVYVTGMYVSPADFGGNTITGNNQTDGFVAKYDLNGTYQSVFRTQSVAGYTNIVNDIAFDGAGNQYITGTYAYGATFGNGITLTPNINDYGNFFVAKFNSAGVAQWAKQTNGNGEEEGRSIAVDASGNAYVAANYTLAPSLDGYMIVPTPNYNRDIFYAKYSTGGELQWFKKSGGEYDESVNAITVDGFGNLYATGFFRGIAFFDEQYLQANNYSNINPSGEDIFLLRIFE
ncbi:hypothetical protein [Emticicia sp. W12TSBA100-4]|uniref:hypothetical protein n=1 Tax=Emticicia sp. W12TSBA100-4 TaxID=3160965 RepID=UPI00330653D4